VGLGHGERVEDETIRWTETVSQSKPPTVAQKPSLYLTYVLQKGANTPPFLKK
jgi:hypothetical protein